MPLPPVSPDYETWGHGRYDDGGHDHSDGGPHNHQSTEQSTNEPSTSLATAKPKHIEDEIQPEVSDFFTPLKIVFYNNGLDNSQVTRLPPDRGAATTVLRTPGKRNIYFP